ncbi:MAG: hypothetical protein HRF45_11765 [Fimbriimonadia bacterium]
MGEAHKSLIGMFCAAWTCLLAAGHYGGLVARGSQVWLDSALPTLTVLYWVLLAASVVYWLWTWRSGAQ